MLETDSGKRVPLPARFVLKKNGRIKGKKKEVAKGCFCIIETKKKRKNISLVCFYIIFWRFW